MYLALALNSCLGCISPLSISSGKPSGIFTAVMNNRLCLLGDFDKQVCFEVSLTVSRYDTTGSDFFNGIPA